MISVETRTFELGMMRMVGQTRMGIIMLLLVQAFSYAIPAWVVGIFFAFLIEMAAANTIFNLTGAFIGYQLTGSGVGVASLMGIIVPVVSSIFPIRNALGQNLQDSIDTKHSKTKAVDVSVERSGSNGPISPSLILVGAGLVVFGSAVYYMMPLGLLSSNFGLLINIFFFLLIGMLLGLIILALNLEHLLERVLTFAFFFWDNRAIR